MGCDTLWVVLGVLWYIWLTRFPVVIMGCQGMGGAVKILSYLSSVKGG